MAVTELNRNILEQIASSSAEGIIVLDARSAELAVVYVNPAYEALTGYSAAESVGRSWRMLEPSDDEFAEIAALKAALGRCQPYEATVPDVRKDGTSWLSRVRAQPISSRRGELRQYLVLQAAAPSTTETERGLQVGLLQRELRRARQKVANLDRLDVASGLLRYEYFLQFADRDYRIAKREKQRVAIAQFKINDLDTYRQTFGTKAADSCLRMIAAQLTGALRRAGDLCGCDDQQRLIAMTLGQDADELRRVVERIRTNVRRLGLHNPRGRCGRYVTVSTALAAHVPSQTSTLTALIEQTTQQLQAVAAQSEDTRRSARA